MAASKTRKSAQSQAHKSIGVIRLTAELYNPDTDQVETKAFELKIPKEQLVAANDLDSFTKLMSDSETIVQEAGTEIMSLCMKSIASQAGAQYQKPKKKKTTADQAIDHRRRDDAGQLPYERALTKDHYQD